MTMRFEGYEGMRVFEGMRVMRVLQVFEGLKVNIKILYVYIIVLHF